MTEANEYWEKRFKSIDFETYDFANSEPAQPLVNFCEKYIKNDDKILDLGCGSGRNSQYLAQQGFEVYGVDVSFAAIEFCKKRFGKLNIKGTFKQGTFEKIPFTDDVFSCVVCTAAFDHVTFEIARTAIVEVRRVLIDKGFVLLTFDPPDTDEEILDEAEVLPDGTYKFVRGEQEGMLFHRYKDEEIYLLLGKENIVSFDISDDGTRVVVCR